MKSNIFNFLVSRFASHGTITPRPFNIVNNNSPTYLRVESILIEEFHRANVASYKSSDELSNIFNIYLILAGIITSGFIGILAIYVQLTTNFGYPFIIDFILIALFALGNIISFFFLSRFVILSYEEYRNIKIMNRIKEFYIEQFEMQMPVIKDLLFSRKDMTTFSGVPSYMHFTVSTFGSGCFSGIIYILIGYIFELKYRQSFFTNTIYLYETDIILYIFLVLAFFLIMFLMYQLYYRRQIRLNKRENCLY